MSSNCIINSPWIYNSPVTCKGLYPSGECELSESDTGLGMDGRLWWAPLWRILWAAFLFSMSRRLYGGWNAQMMRIAKATAAAVMKYMAYWRSGTLPSSELSDWHFALLDCGLGTSNAWQTNMKTTPVACLKGEKWKRSYSSVRSMAQNPHKHLYCCDSIPPNQTNS